MKSLLFYLLVLGCISHSAIAQGFNNSLRFETDDYVNLNSIAQDVSNLSEFTIEFWVQFEAIKNTDFNVFYAVNSSDFGNRFLIRFAEPTDGITDAAVVYINDGSNQYIYGSTPIGDNKCHHIAFTYNNGVCLLYVDGQLDGSGNYMIEQQVTDLYSFGQEYDNFPIRTSQFYNGKLDDFRIWETAKTEHEIQSYKDAELTGNEPSLVSYFNFNQGFPAANNSGITELNNLAQLNQSGTLINFNLSGSTSNFLSGDCSNTLPVEFFSFDASVIEKDVLLSWQTSSELNNEKFDVEESKDGIEFQKIGEVKGKETTQALNSYTYRVPHSHTGLIYYRLKQVDFNGQFDYSKIVSVNLAGERKQIEYFYPNPSKSGVFNLSYTSKNAIPINITVFDTKGRKVFSQKYPVSIGRNILNINIPIVHKGALIARVDTGKRQVYRKLLIK